MAAERNVARARIALGTLVEIALPATMATDARFDAGFAAITRVHEKMSTHDSGSDLARIAREAHRWPVVVDPWTYSVLELALGLWRASRGAFDITVAPVLAQAGQLPARAAPEGTERGRMSALRLFPDMRVRTTSPVALDLGGIAKGFAVDRAVDALRATGASAGRVNAGGDLRVFGVDAWTTVHVRHPRAPHLTLALFGVRDFAVATSADYFSAGPALVDPQPRRVRFRAGSLTIAAPTCALADALTKIVELEPARAPALLALYEAHAFRIAGDRDESLCETTCRESTARLRLPPALAA